MEAVERWTSHYPELEPLSVCLKKFHDSIRGFGEPSPVLGETQARTNILAETAEMRDHITALQAEMQPAREIMMEVPLDSLASLHAQLQSPSAHVTGSEALCESLLVILDGSNRVAPSQTNELLEAWVQEFVREPLEEMFQHAQQVSSQLEMNMTVEHGIMTRIRALSEQICEPGYRADRVELMDTRSVLVQQLLNALVAKQRVVGASEAKMALLEKKQRSFEQAQSTCLRARRAEVARHGTIAEELVRLDERLDRYRQQKLQTCTSEGKAVEERREQRMRKVLRASQILQDALSGILETIEECRHDTTRHSLAAVEREHASQVTDDLKRAIIETQDFYASVSMRTEKAVKLEMNFSDWLQQAYGAMREQATQSFQALRVNFSTDKARMLSLSRIAVEHVRAQREQVARALEQKTLEAISWKEAVSMLEFSRPGNEEIAKTLGRLESVQESVKWQKHEVEALTIVEDRISHDAAEIVSDTFGNECQAILREEEWAQEVADADAWVTDFFYTWSRDVSMQQPALDNGTTPTGLGMRRHAGQWQLTAGTPPVHTGMLMGSAAGTDVEENRVTPQGAVLQVVSPDAPIGGKKAGSSTGSPRHFAVPRNPFDAATAPGSRLSPRAALMPSQASPHHERVRAATHPSSGPRTAAVSSLTPPVVECEALRRGVHLTTSGGAAGGNQDGLDNTGSFLASSARQPHVIRRLASDGAITTVTASPATASQSVTPGTSQVQQRQVPSLRERLNLRTLPAGDSVQQPLGESAPVVVATSETLQVTQPAVSLTSPRGVSFSTSATASAGGGATCSRSGPVRQASLPFMPSQTGKKDALPLFVGGSQHSLTRQALTHSAEMGLTSLGSYRPVERRDVPSSGLSALGGTVAICPAPARRSIASIGTRQVVDFSASASTGSVSSAAAPAPAPSGRMVIRSSSAASLLQRK